MKDEKDPKKDPEEELKKLMEELENYKNKRNSSLNLAFLLHKNYVIHIILSFIVNLTMAASVIGIALSFEYDIVQMEPIGFVIAVVLLTMVENMIKIILFKYMLKLMIYSLGLLSWLINFISWYAISLLMNTGFRFLSVLDLMVYTTIFIFLRFIASVYIRRWFFSKKIFIVGGKK